MSEPAPPNQFTGDVAALADFDPNLAVAGHENKGYLTLFDVFTKAAKFAEEKGDKQSAAALAFLAVLTGFGDSFDTPQTPFMPMIQLEGRRSAIPSDLTNTDLEALKVLAAKTTVHVLRARLHDVLWVRAKIVSAGQEAARQYIEAAKLQDNDEDWTDALRSFKRALQLAATFGRTKPLFNETVGAVETSVKASASAKEGYRTLMLARVLFTHKVGKPSEYATLMSQVAQQAEAAGDFRRCTEYRDHEAEWHFATGESKAAMNARLMGAEAALKLAEARAADGNAALAASQLYIEAIEKLQRAEAPKARILEAKERLNQLQEAAVAEMKTFDVKFDISGEIAKAQEYVRSDNFRVSVLKLVRGVPLFDPVKVRADVLATAKEFPLSHLIPRGQVDEKGRTTAVQGAVLGGTPEEQQASIHAQMFAHVKPQWALIVNAFITPAREEILTIHFPTFEDLAFLVRNNPFVPPRHERTILRGLHAGFYGDFVVAAHILTPQIENSIRYVLESRGVDVSHLKPDGTQPVKILGGLLELPETEKAFGAPMVFELRGCLIEKTGFDFRNRVAHGFVSDPECDSPAATLVWWQFLRLCFTAHLLTQPPSEPARPAEKNGEASGDCARGPSGS